MMLDVDQPTIRVGDEGDDATLMMDAILVMIVAMVTMGLVFSIKGDDG